MLRGLSQKNVNEMLFRISPTKFGKVSKFRFIKGDEHNDLNEVSREELISTLEKCHDTVWQGGKLAPTTAFDEVQSFYFVN